MGQFQSRNACFALITGCVLTFSPMPGRALPAPAASTQDQQVLDPNTKFRLWLRAESVLILRRLLATVDISSKPDGAPERYDLELMEAVRKFQRRIGFEDTGIARRKTIVQLNQAAARAMAKDPRTPPAHAPAVPATVATPPTATPAPSSTPVTSTPAPSAAPAPATTPPAPAPASASTMVPPTSPAPAAVPVLPPRNAKAATEKAKRGAVSDKVSPAKSTVRCDSHLNDKVGPAELPMVDGDSVARQRGAIARYAAIAAAGGFPAVSKRPKSGYCLGQDDPAVATVVARLIADAYLPESHRGATVYGPPVVEAVKHFQDAHGLVPSGRIGGDTLEAMNVPVGERLAALRASLTRLERIVARRELAAKEPRVVVNLASATVQVLDGTNLLAGYRVIVGRDGRPSPEFISTIPDIQVLPVWHVPRSILARDIAPNIRRNPGYLESGHMRALRNGREVAPALVNWRTGPFPDVEQRPGRSNALGPIRFGVGNNRSFYLHGTANPALLDRSLAKRFLSSGCVRLADPTQLAELILRGTPDADGAPWTVEKLRARIDAHDGGWKPGQKIRLAKPVPLVWTYLTGWVTRDGRVHFRPDRYERQEEETAQIRQKPLDRAEEASQPSARRS